MENAGDGAPVSGNNRTTSTPLPRSSCALRLAARFAGSSEPPAGEALGQTLWSLGHLALLEDALLRRLRAAAGRRVPLPQPARQQSAMEGGEEMYVRHKLNDSCPLITLFVKR